MSHASNDALRQAIPAQLEFLTLFNPSLGTSDETLEQQIVYFFSSDSTIKKDIRNADPDCDINIKDVANERLRQIGLAQGMVEFAKTFSEGRFIDSVETEKSRIVLHELEPGWWILASISLTRLPASQKSRLDKAASSLSDFEYSSREVKPANLLLQELLRAHSTFLLHHATSLSALFVRCRRHKFVRILGRYWEAFSVSWNVMLHGNPAVNIYGGIRLAVSGELGMGVGEEERGSGEREVLEGFVGRIEGMVDLVVSKFGAAVPSHTIKQEGVQSRLEGDLQPSQPWLGTGAELGVDDGAIFLGTGALSRKSLRDITYWMEDLYSWGQHAYGVSVNVSNPDRRPGKRPPKEVKASKHVLLPKEYPNLPGQTIIDRADEALNATSICSGTSKSSRMVQNPGPSGIDAFPGKLLRAPYQASDTADKDNSTVATSTNTDRLISFLKFGYGTHWSLGVESTTKDKISVRSLNADIPGKVTDLIPRNSTILPDLKTSSSVGVGMSAISQDYQPHFLVGLAGDLEEADFIDNTPPVSDSQIGSSGGRILLRTVTVELERATITRSEADISIDLGSNNMQIQKTSGGTSQHTTTSASTWESQDRNKAHKLRVVVYVSRPFIFTFFFELRTESLAFADLYKSLHHQLAPLQSSLLKSTQHPLPRPQAAIATHEIPQAPIYDLIWDPASLTIMSTIPNIPDPICQQENDSRWSRIEAVNTHSHILGMYTSTRNTTRQIEHTSKTSRGWWIIWTRAISSNPPTGSANPGTALQNGLDIARKKPKTALQTSNASSVTQSLKFAHPSPDRSTGMETFAPSAKEIFLVRQASDYHKGGSLTTKAMIGDGWAMSSWTGGGLRLAQGIGLDTRHYIDGLLNIAK